MAKKKSRRGLTGIIALVLIVVVGIAITIYLVGQQQDPRSRASEDFRNINSSQQISPSGSCDIDGDQQIDLADYSTLVECVKGSDICTPSAQELSDLNADGSIDTIDLNFFQRTCGS